MKICFISPFINKLFLTNRGGTGGAERQFWLFGHGLTQQGAEVAYITASPGENDTFQEEAKQFDIRFADFSWMNGAKWRLVSGFFSLLKTMRKTHADVFIVKTPSLLLVPMLVYRMFFGAKVIFWAQTSHDAACFREGINRIASSLQNWTMLRTNAVIAQTSDQKNDFLKNFGIQAVHIPNIYYEEKDDGKVVESDVFWCGNSSKNKRQEIVLELAKRMPDLHFLIAMNPASPERFEQAQKEAEALPNVTFAGTIPQSEIMNCYRGCKLYLNTSAREGFPNTFLQAWGAGKPVLSICINPDHVLEKHQLGECIFQPADNNRDIDSEDFFNKTEETMRRLLLHSSDYQKRGIEYLRQYHNAKQLTTQLIGVLHHLFPENQG